MLDRDEWRQLLQANYLMDADAADKAYDAWDLDNVNGIDFEEYCEMMADVIKTQEKVVRDHSSALDQNPEDVKELQRLEAYGNFWCCCTFGASKKLYVEKREEMASKVCATSNDGLSRPTSSYGRPSPLAPLAAPASSPPPAHFPRHPRPHISLATRSPIAHPCSAPPVARRRAARWRMPARPT